MVLMSSHLFKICLKLCGLEGVLLYFWRVGLGFDTILANFGGFNLFKLGDSSVGFNLLLADSVLTGDVFFTLAVSSSCKAWVGWFLVAFVAIFFLLVVNLNPKSSTQIILILPSFSLFSSCHTTGWHDVVLLQLLSVVIVLVLAG